MSDWKFPHSDHLSPSQITEWLGCPACYKLNRIDKLAKPMNVALPIGGAVHKAVESQRENMLKQGDLTGSDVFVEYAADHFDKSLEVDDETGGEVMLDLGEYKDIGAARDHTVKLVKFVLPEIAKLDAKRGLIAAELDLRDFENVNPWPFQMYGRIDALYGPDPEQCSAGSDLKTSSKQMAPMFLAALQIGIYRAFLPVLWHADVVAKTKAPSFQTYTLSEDGDDFVRNIVMEVAGKIRDGEFPARPGYLCKFEHGNPTFSVAVSGFDSAA